MCVFVSGNVPPLRSLKSHSHSSKKISEAFCFIYLSSTGVLQRQVRKTCCTKFNLRVPELYKPPFDVINFQKRLTIHLALGFGGEKIHCTEFYLSVHQTNISGQQAYLKTQYRASVQPCPFMHSLAFFDLPVF